MPDKLTSEAVRARVESAFGGIRADLDDLVRIPSVSADAFDADEVRRSAEATAAWMKHSELSGVRLLEVDGAASCGVRC